MDLPEPFRFVVDALADWLGDEPGSARWETVTAIVGWIGAGVCLGWLVTSVAGFPDVAGFLIGAFWLTLGISFRREIAKWRHVYRQRQQRRRR